MERISRKKRKRRIFASIVILLSIAIILSSFLIFSLKNSSKARGVIIGNIRFQDVNNDVFILYDSVNLDNNTKICSVDINLSDSVTYHEVLEIEPYFKKTNKLLVDMPQGKTKVRLMYNCSKKTIQSD